MPKLDAPKLSPDAQEDRRRRVVTAVRGGVGETEAAKMWGIMNKKSSASDER